MRQIVLDTETTGLHVAEGHRIIEIGCIELINRKRTGQHFHQYINPERLIDEGAFNVHGISNHFLSAKPLFINIVDSFLDFIKDAELIIHNAPFDIGFINYELSLLNRSHLAAHHINRVIDTLVLARQLHMGQRNNLDALCKRYKIDNQDRELHGALLDAHLLSQVYLAMTGGQSSLFDDMLPQGSTREAEDGMTKITNLSVSSHQLSILKADETELAAHQQFLEQLLQRGKCVWEHL